MKEIERWRNIPGYPNYRASSFGRVKVKKTRLIKAQHYRGIFRDYDGILRNSISCFITLWHKGKRKYFYTSRLVAFVFLEPHPIAPFEECEVHHIKVEDPPNNHASNLMILTYWEHHRLHDEKRRNKNEEI